MWYKPSAYIKERKKMAPIILYKNIRGEPRGGGDSPSCMIMEEPSRSVEKRTRKSINHFSFFLSSPSGIYNRPCAIFVSVSKTYEIAPAILKIGRYMATTRPPIVAPKNTSIKGSINAVRFSTAWSTSSS